MPSSRRKFPGAQKTNIHIGDEVYTLWTCAPRSETEESALLTELREEKIAWRERIERSRKRKRSLQKREDRIEEGDTGGSEDGSGSGVGDNKSDFGRFIENARSVYLLQFFFSEAGIMERIVLI
jgi:hypothetical protein